MRETFTSLQSGAADATQTETTDTVVNTFLKKELNFAYRYMLAELDLYKTQTSGSQTTTSGTQYYNYPAGLVSLESVTVTIGSVVYNLIPIDSQASWNNLNSLTFQGTAIPKYFFPRTLDFGIWPIPQASTYTITYVYNPRFPDFANEDYTTGTVSLTNGSATVTGSGTTFTAAMVGRWFKANTDGTWYKITGFTSTTVLTINRTFEGTTAASLAYTIGESPQLPEEGHELLVFRAAQMYFIKKQSDPVKSTFWSNMFFTGDPTNTTRDLSVDAGFLGLKKRYAARSSVGLIDRGVNKSPDHIGDKIWATTLSS